MKQHWYVVIGGKLRAVLPRQFQYFLSPLAELSLVLPAGLGELGRVRVLAAVEPGKRGDEDPFLLQDLNTQGQVQPVKAVGDGKPLPRYAVFVQKELPLRVRRHEPFHD